MRRSPHRLILGLILAMIGIVAAFLLLPFALDALLLPALLKRLPIDDRYVSVGRLTPFSASGTLRFNDGDTPILAVPRFELSFKPSDLFKKKFSALVLDHASIHLHRQGDRYVLPGFSTDPEQQEPALRTAALLLPLTVDRLILNQCSLVLHDGRQPPLRLTVSAGITPTFEHDRSGAYRLHALRGLFTLSDPLLGSGNVSVAATTDGYLLSLNVENGAADLPERFIPLPLRGSSLGPVTVTASLTVAAAPPAILHLDLRGTLNHPILSAHPFELRGKEPDGTVSLSVTGTPTDLRYTVSTLDLSTPGARFQVAPSGTAVIDPDGLRLDGTLNISAVTTTARSPTDLPVSLSYEGEMRRNGDWQLHLDGQMQGAAPLDLPGGTITLAAPAAEINGEIRGRPRQLSGEFNLDVPHLHLHQASTELELANLQGRIQFDHRGGRTTADIKVTAEQALLPRQGLRFKAIDLALPLVLPLSLPPGAGSNEPLAAGSFAIGSLGLHDSPLAALSGSISQQDEAFQLTATLRALFAPELKLAIQGSVQPTAGQFELSWQLPPAAVASSLLPEIATFPETLEVTGLLSAHGTLHRTGTHLGGSLQSLFEGGTVTLAERNLSVTDLNCSLTLPHLPVPVSEPSQRCSAGVVDIGALHFTNATVSFRLEDVHTVFIEKSKVNWCQGTLESGSIRLSTQDPEVDTVLYSSRINFAELLNQFGFDQTEGQGALNGKLPIRWSNNRLFFDDGFLFSTPGTGGIVRFTDTDLLRQGMGEVQQTGSLGYALRALEDFAYNWTRLSFNSSGDELLLSMELDGKPRTPLPYSFKNGMLVESEQGNLQYPIRLDINLSLPLAELLQIGHNVKSIMGN